MKRSMEVFALTCFCIFLGVAALIVVPLVAALCLLPLFAAVGIAMAAALVLPEWAGWASGVLCLALLGIWYYAASRFVGPASTSRSVSILHV